MKVTVKNEKLPDKILDSDPNVSYSDSVSQQVINIQILSQLQSLSKRLDDMEAKNCKKKRLLIKPK